MIDIKFETAPDGTEIAYREDGGEDFGRCGLFWLGGFKSDMAGSKAEALASLARDTRRSSFRFDYSGHGSSGGFFVDGTISAWLAQALHMFTRKAAGKRIIVGSSMGGWLAMLLYRALQRDPRAARRVAGLVLIAPATDMTADLMWDVFPDSVKEELAEKGVYLRPSEYGEPYPITARLIADGEKHLMLKDGLACDCPVRILQGDIDPDVPPAHGVKVFNAIRGSDVTLTLIKGGDHRLSSPTHLALIRETALRLAERADGVTV
jgi:pimeloyl-ACP methyl ester carboxylesterase